MEIKNDQQWNDLCTTYLLLDNEIRSNQNVGSLLPRLIQCRNTLAKILVDNDQDTERRMKLKNPIEANSIEENALAE